MATTDRKVLDRIIGPRCGLADVAAAFSGAIPSTAYSWHAQAELRGEVIAIEGLICNGEADVGRYERRLSFERGAALATHEIFEVARPHRRNGIALAQYTASFAFYESIGIRSVRLHAACTSGRPSVSI